MRPCRKIWYGFLFIIALILLCQCSPYAGKSLLTFFFDGVPEADTLAGISDQGKVSPDSTTLLGVPIALNEPTMWIHYPYAERECAACHDEQSLGNMTEEQPGLCFICHEDFSANYTHLHGPVAGGFCTSCHDPHSSKNEKLLRFTGDDLCFHCHKKESVYRNEMHEGLDGMGCADCHNPHGGEDRYIFH